MRFFAYDSEDGLTAHATAEAAKADAEARHASWLEHINYDGEHTDSAETTCWGVLLGSVKTTEHHHQDDCPRGEEHAPDCEGCEHPGDCAREYCRDGCEVPWGYDSVVTIELVDLPDPRDAEIAELKENVARLEAWLSRIEGGDNPCDDPRQLREWAWRAGMRQEVPE